MFKKKYAKKTEQEKVAERREEVLATGRKFKYPLQWTKHRIVINTILISVVVIAVIIMAIWLALYRLNMTDDLLFRITKVVPLPVATVDSEDVRFSDYLTFYRSSITSIERQSGSQFDESSAEQLKAEYKRAALTESEDYTYAVKLAKEKGIKVRFGKADIKDAHPNSVEIKLVGEHGRQLSIVGESVGGSLINIAKIDGLDANFSGDFPTLIVHNQDQPGHVAEVTGMLAEKSVNIATMQLYRANRGGNAVMVIECDQEVPEKYLEWLKNLDGVNKVTYYSLIEEGKNEF